MITVAFDPEPYTLVAVEGFRQVWDASQPEASVVYLWCIEYEAAYLVNYVGKTWNSRGFAYRLWPELQEWRSGYYKGRVDLEAFRRGRRIVASTFLGARPTLGTRASGT